MNRLEDEEVWKRTSWWWQYGMKSVVARAVADLGDEVSWVLGHGIRCARNTCKRARHQPKCTLDATFATSFLPLKGEW